MPVRCGRRIGWNSCPWGRSSPGPRSRSHRPSRAIFLVLASHAVDDVGLLSGMAVLFVLGIAGCFLLSLTGTHRATLPFQLRLFFGAYGLRFLMSLVLYAFGLVKLFKDEDGSGWVVGVAFHQDWVDRGV